LKSSSADDISFGGKVLALHYFERNSSDHLDEVMKMTDYVTAKIMAHRRNIIRYSRLLATHLTELEREYIHKQIAVEQSKIENLELQVKRASQVSSGTEQSPDPT
jgi:hypothetical protein